MVKVLTIFFSFLVIITCAQTKEESNILKLSRTKFRWMIEGKTDSLSLILDERLSYIHSNGWVQTKKEFIDDFNRKLIYYDIKLSELHVRVYRRSAVVTGKGHFSVSLEGSRVETTLFFTEVYIRNGNKWKLASRHANKIG